jgi:hypothetical protein
MWRVKKKWPAWLRLLVTCRSDANILQYFKPKQQLSAKTKVKGAKKATKTKSSSSSTPKQDALKIVDLLNGDKQFFAIKQFVKEELRNKIETRDGDDWDSFIENFARKSKGIFLWARFVLENLLASYCGKSGHSLTPSTIHLHLFFSLNMIFW